MSNFRKNYSLNYKFETEIAAKVEKGQFRDLVIHNSSVFVLYGNEDASFSMIFSVMISGGSSVEYMYAKCNK